jgi:hypothetical protein
MTNDSSNQADGDSVSRVVSALRDIRRMPVNFIEADERVEGPVVEKGGGAEEALDSLVAQAPIYRWSRIAERNILFPRAAIWEAQIRGAPIANVPRLEAATQFVALVRNNMPELADLSEPPMIGDPAAPVYTERVSLPPDGTILQYLVALLGADPRTIFTIQRSRFGERVLHFDRVAE